MSGDVSSTLFQNIGKSLENATNAYVVNTSGHLMAAITPWVVSGIGLWVALYGYQVISGKVKEPFLDFLFKTIRTIVICYVALHSDVYLEWVVGFLKSLETTLTSVVTQGKFQSLYENLDHSLSQGMALLEQIQEKIVNAKLSEMGKMFKWLLVGIVHAVAFSIIALVSGVAIIKACVMLKILFAIGPLFLVCLIWPVTARFFEHWMAQAMTYLFRMVLSAMIITLCLKVFEYYTKKVDLTGTHDQNVLMVALECFLAGIILYNLIKEIIGMSGQLGGGLSTAVMGFGELALASKSPFNATKNFLNPQKTRRDLKTGIVSGSTRLGHMASGNTFLNPAYVQASWRNMRSRWGRMMGGNIQSD